MAKEKNSYAILYLWAAISMVFGFSFMSVYALVRIEPTVCEFTYEDILQGRDGSIVVGIGEMDATDRNLDDCAKEITLRELYDDFKIYHAETEDEIKTLFGRNINRMDEINELKEFLGIHTIFGKLTDKPDMIEFDLICGMRGWDEVIYVNGDADEDKIIIEKCRKLENKLFKDND